jgi:signal peptidase
VHRAHRRRVARNLRIIRDVLFGVITVISIGIFALSATGTARLVPVLSNSMAPRMPVGSLALTLPAPRNDLAPGDVIVFTNPNQPAIRVIHRIIHVYEADEGASFATWDSSLLYVDTQGDNNPAADPWVLTLADDTVWRLETSVPFLGQPAIWFINPQLKQGGFFAAVLGLTSWTLVSLWRRPRRDDTPLPTGTDLAPGAATAAVAAETIASRP